MQKSFAEKIVTIQQSLNENENITLYRAARHSRAGKCEKYIVTYNDITYIGIIPNQKGNVLEIYNNALIKLRNKELKKDNH